MMTADQIRNIVNRLKNAPFRYNRQLLSYSLLNSLLHTCTLQLTQHVAVLRLMEAPREKVSYIYFKDNRFIYLFIYLFICVFNYFYIHLFIFLLVHLFIYLFFIFFSKSFNSLFLLTNIHDFSIHD